jgi:hypothetical protein
MRSSGAPLVEAALRCYPARWRRRHGDEAADLAALLIADGAPAASIAWSYLTGAARAWLAPRPGRSPRRVAAALLAAACLLGFSAALVAESGPAKAASTIKPAPPGAGSPDQVTPCRPRQATGAVPAPGHPQLSSQGTAHVRSC